MSARLLMGSRLLTGVLSVLLVCAALALRADEKSDRTAAARSQTRPAAAEPISAEAEADALKFVRTQHPELADLLDGLQRSNQAAYQSALRDVARDVERLNKLAERDAERYQLSLAIWNLDSRIRLAIARLSMSTDAEVESTLRPLMEERQTARLALLEYDALRLQERSEKAREQWKTARESSAQRVDAELERIQRLVSSRSKARATAADRPAKLRSQAPQSASRPKKPATADTATDRTETQDAAGESSPPAKQKQK